MSKLLYYQILFHISFLSMGLGYSGDPPAMKIPYSDVKGDSSLTVAETPVPPGSFAEISYPLQKGDTVQWEISPNPVKQVSFVGVASTDKEVSIASLYFNGLPGTYTVTAFVINFKAEKFERRKVTVVIGGTVPPVPPKPDDPPTPVNTELRKKIKEALDLDKGEKADMVQLAALYREAAKISIKKTVDGKYEVPSSKELLRRVRESSATLIGTDVLTNVRIIAAGELAGALGMPTDDDLTDFQRRSVADTFNKLGATIESLYP